MFLKIYYLSGNIKYSGWIKGIPSWIKQRRKQEKIYDIGGFTLFFYEGKKVIVMDEKGNKIDQGIVKDGKITKFFATNDLLTNISPQEYENRNLIFRQYDYYIDNSDNNDNNNNNDDDNSLISEVTDDSSSTDDSSEDDFNYIFSYDGQMFEEMPNGEGILKKNDQVIYDGNFVDGQECGIGTFFFGGHKVHHGQYLNGDCHGKGKLYNPETKEMIFDGIFKKGFPFYGKFYCNEELVFEGFFKNYSGELAWFCLDQGYIGEFKNGKKNGYGYFFSEKNIIYKGCWENDLYHGKGVLFDKYDDVIYEGCWKNGMKNGYGIFYDKEYGVCSKYAGDFCDDKKDGYGVIYYDSFGKWKKWYSGWWKNNKKNGDGLCFNENKLYYEGQMKDNSESGFGKRFYQDGTLQYKGYFDENEYSGEGILYYIDGTICFEGTFKNGNPCNGTFYNFEDGKVYNTEIINDDYYTKGVLIEPETNGVIYYQGNFKNGLFHGEAKSQDYTGSFKDGKFHGQGIFYSKWSDVEYKGQFINGLYWDGKKLKSVHSNEVVYEGTIKDENYDTGIETIYDDDDEDYEYDPIGYRKWKDGKIVDEKEERRYLRQKMLIYSFLETKNKKILNKIYKKDYLKFLEEKYDIYNVEVKTKKQLVRIIEEQKKKEKVQRSFNTEPTKFDLFGNEIVKPCRGNDGNIYDESSMLYLFKKDESNEYINIQYRYKESANNPCESVIKIPNYPVMTNGKILDGYSYLE